jgi:hypothetical protein
MDRFRNPNPRGESFIDEEDSVEGHQMPRFGDDKDVEDVEGHTAGGSNKGKKLDDDADVEGHTAGGSNKGKKLDDEDDVEGHGAKNLKR